MAYVGRVRRNKVPNQTLSDIPIVAPIDILAIAHDRVMAAYHQWCAASRQEYRADLVEAALLASMMAADDKRAVMRLIEELQGAAAPGD